MPRVVDRAPASQNRALGQILAAAGAGLTGVPISQDAGLSSKFLRGAGLGIQAAQKRGDIQFRQQVHQDRTGIARQKYAQDAVEEQQVDAFNRAQVDHFQNQYQIDLTEFKDMDFGKIHPGTVSTMLNRYKEDLELGDSDAKFKAFDRMEDAVVKDQMMRLTRQAMDIESGALVFAEDQTDEDKAETVMKLQMERDRISSEYDELMSLRILRRREIDPEFIDDSPERAMAYFMMAKKQLEREFAGNGSGTLTVAGWLIARRARQLAAKGGWQVRPPKKATPSK